MTATFMVVPVSEEGVRVSLADESLGDFLAGARIAREDGKSASSRRGGRGIILRRGEGGFLHDEGRPALQTPGGFALHRAQADVHTDVSQSRTNRLARVALGSQSRDLGLECPRLAVNAAGWMLGIQSHSRLLLECEPS